MDFPEIPAQYAVYMALRQRNRAGSTPEFTSALKLFLGYLEGTGKSEHTIRNYQTDLMTFDRFLSEGLGSRKVSLSQVNRADLLKFHEFLKLQGFRNNTRRRKLLTLRKLLRFLVRRGKLKLDIGDQLPAPAKVERVPKTFITQDLLGKIQALPGESELAQRNRILLWTLAETGCRVSELGGLHRGSLRKEGPGGKLGLQFDGKFERWVPISSELAKALGELPDAKRVTPAPARGSSEQLQLLFCGHNRHGSLGGAITSRGVELLVKSAAPALGLKNDATPRIFRHSAVIAWHRNGVERAEIQRRLGLRTDYSFRIYDPLLKDATT